MKPEPMTKSRLAALCCVTTRTVQTWCNRIYFEKLQEMGYYKTQKTFTPKQWHFLTDQLVLTED